MQLHLTKVRSSADMFVISYSCVSAFVTSQVNCELFVLSG